VTVDGIPDVRLAHFTDSVLVGRLDLGDDMEILEGSDGMHYFSHLCVRPEKVTIYCAPKLSKHTRTGPLASITIRASILCPDCKLHGFVTDGAWRSA
jgi:hypothetical protein